MAEEKIAFNVKFAVKNWRERHNYDDQEIVRILRRELKDCNRKKATYPNTITHIEDMLHELGVKA